MQLVKSMLSIVNAANEYLMYGSGAAGAIASAGGQYIYYKGVENLGRIHMNTQNCMVK